MARQDESVLYKPGTYGKVLIEEYYGTVCAAKESISLGVSPKGAEITECQRMLQLRHSRIVQFSGSPAVPLIVMKMMDCSLHTLLECYPDVPIDLKLSILLGVSLGLKFLRSQKPSGVHYKLSSNSILLTPHLQAKISDMGVAALAPGPGKPVKKYMKTTRYVVPEICKSTTAKPAAKIFDLAVEVLSYCTTLHTATQLQPEPNRQPSSKVNQYIDKDVSGDKVPGSLVQGSLDDVPNKCPPTDEVLAKSEKYTVTQKSVVACQTKQLQVEQVRIYIHYYTLYYCMPNNLCLRIRLSS